MTILQLLYTASRTAHSKFSVFHTHVNRYLKPQRFSLVTSHFSTSFLITKTPQKFKKKRKKKESPRTKLVQTEPNLIAHFENILHRDAHFRFLTRTKEYLSKQPQQVLRLDDAGKLYQKLGFPRGRKVLKKNRHILIRIIGDKPNTYYYFLVMIHAIVFK